MINLKFDFSRHVYGANQSLVNAPPLGGEPSPCGLTYLSRPEGIYSVAPTTSPTFITRTFR